jgi:DNA-binding LytR/AlgR family response regulator
MIENDVNISHHIYTNPNTLLADYSAPGTYDILFLDVEMSGMDGLSLAEKIKHIDRHTYIIFVSNYPKYMQDSFRTHPFYYLIKPLSDDIFSKIMNDIISNIEAEHKLVTLLHLDKKEETVNIKDIRIIEVNNSRKGILCFHFFCHKTLTKGTIQEWIAKLSEFDFFQCKRGLLINMIHIHYIEAHNVIMDNGETVPLSRNNAKKLKERYAKNVVRLKNL